MSIEEIIEGLGTIIEQAFGLPKGAEAHALSAISAAIEKLETHPDNQPNEPLTEEELRGMVGEWVWVTVHYIHCDCSGWALICTGATLGYLDQMLSIKDCGTKFDAHRRPPEGAT